MNKILFGFLLAIPTLSFAGTGTTYFGTGGGTVVMSSGTSSAAVSNSSSTLVQSLIDGGNSSSLGVSFGGATTAGNIIYVAIGMASETFAISVLSNSCGDTFTEATNSPVTGTGGRIRVYTAPTAGGCSSIAITSDTSAPYNVIAAEYSNPTAASPVDCDTAGSGNSVNLLTTSPTCTTTHAGDTLIALGFQPIDSATYTAGSGYTVQQQNGGTGHSIVMEDKHVTTTGTYTGSATSDTSGEWTIHMIAIKANP